MKQKKIVNCCECRMAVLKIKTAEGYKKCDLVSVKYIAGGEYGDTVITLTGKILTNAIISDKGTEIGYIEHECKKRKKERRCRIRN